MTPESFVAVVQDVVVESGVRTATSHLERPSRGILPTVEEHAKWFQALAVDDRQHLEIAMRLAAEATAFGFFAVLDGSRAIESGPDQGELELYYVKGAERTRLNDESVDLHEMYRGVRTVLR